jgi:hypothetical protein
MVSFGMTVIERFLSFAKGLPADRRVAVEEGLAALMESYSEKYGFSTDELAEIDRRLAEPKPQFALPSEVSRIFGKPFSE